MAITGAVLLLPIGPPGIGKSDLAERLVARGCIDAGAVVSPDYFRQVLTGNRASQSANADVFKICHWITRVRLERGLPVYFDATNLTTLNEMVRLALDTGADVYPVTFGHITLEELTQRNRNRNWPVPDDVLVRMWGQYLDLLASTLPGIKTVTGDQLLETGLR